MSRNVKSSKELNLSDKYQLEYEEYVPDCKGAGIVLRHKKSGARINIISNDDENKVFCIMFRTPPTDDTGVAHIIEHSVLSGSEKFPTKDPFMDLAKGSLNTFLNALTFPDKTCYPVASCNDRDFANLMDVYMDAVLHPNIYTRPQIFKQEGWHYELESKDDPITINGVVYSEMKGAFSSPDDKLMRETFSCLFPDTAYGVESGGDPKAIPELTYENFLDFHRRYYHPTNSYIYLYGNIDIEERLDWLDSAYLSSYDIQPVDSEIKKQKPIGVLEKTGYYAIAEEESEDSADLLTWAAIIGESNELEKLQAFDIISNCLFNVPGAPLRERLIGEGIGQDLYCGVDSNLCQPIIQITVKNTSAEKMDLFKQILREELERIVREGIDRNSLAGVLNRTEFEYAESDFGYLPKGIAYAINSASTWLYNDSEAFTQLHRGDVFEALREKINTGYYEELIKRYLLDSDSCIYYSLIAKRGYSKEENDRLEKKLAAYKESLSEEELDALIAENAALKEYQSTPSTPEELATIPMLTREDLDPEPLELRNEEFEIENVSVKYHNYETNDIVYLKLLFDMDKLNEEQLQLTELICKLVGAVNTEAYSYPVLNSLINMHTGGINMSIVSFNRRGSRDYYRPMLSVDAKFMKHELDNALMLIKELILKTDYSSLKRVRELMGETRARMQSYFVESGDHVAMRRAAAGVSSANAFTELIEGISYYRFIEKMLAKSDDELLESIAEIKSIINMIIGRDNCIIDITCNSELMESVTEKLPEFVNSLTCVGAKAGDHCGPLLAGGDKSVLIRYSGEVNYVCLAGRFEELSLKQSGIMNVANKLVSREFLYNKLRVLGGAYGAGLVVNTLSGIGVYFSYRDPGLKNTIDTYGTVADFIRSFNPDDRTVLKLIIGTIGGMTRPLSPSSKGARALAKLLEGTTYEMLKEVRKAIINTTAEDIRALAPIFEQLTENSSVCAVACEKSSETEGSCLEKQEQMF